MNNAEGHARYYAIRAFSLMQQRPVGPTGWAGREIDTHRDYGLHSVRIGRYEQVTSAAFWRIERAGEH